MEIDNTEVKECLDLIEAKLNWGSGSLWTTRDYLNLSEKIFEETGVTLSVATLKRIWGKVSYSSNPTITTLDTLTQFIGFENWRSFKQSRAKNSEFESKPKLSVEASKFAMGSFGKLVIFVSILFLLGWTQFRIPEVPYEPLERDNFSFSSMKIVREGVPNSVLFSYNASAADDRDTIMIQQSWDKRLSAKVKKTDKNHSSIYYHPGYFKAKLVVRDTVVKEHAIFIKTKGWLPLIDRGISTPVYFNESEAIRSDGSLYLSPEQIEAKNIPMQPDIPWINYYYMTDFEGLNLRNFVFETRLKNTYNEGAGKCQNTNIELRFSGGLFLIPLCSKGCVGGLRMKDFHGEIKDLTGLGVDFSNWVDVKLRVQEGVGKLYINDKLALNLGFNVTPLDFKGVRFQFQGGGAVDQVTFSKPTGQIVKNETF